MTSLSQFPTDLDTFKDPQPSDGAQWVHMDGTIRSGPDNNSAIIVAADPTLVHTYQHDLINDAVAALQAKVGKNGSAVTSSLDYILKIGQFLASNLWQKRQKNSSVSLTVTGSNINNSVALDWSATDFWVLDASALSAGTYNWPGFTNLSAGTGTLLVIQPSGGGVKVAFSGMKLGASVGFVTGAAGGWSAYGFIAKDTSSVGVSSGGDMA